MNIVRPLCASIRWCALALLACAPALSTAATLERLSMDDMVQKSTAIVRGRILGGSASFRGAAGRGGTIYTHYNVQVLERWKGNGSAQMDVAVPGGVANGVRQTFPGSPVLDLNGEYVLFLWTGKSGLTQVIGLSQGLMGVSLDASGKTVVTRGASTEPMIDASGHPVTDSGFSMSLNQFQSTMRGYGMVDTK